MKTLTLVALGTTACFTLAACDAGDSSTDNTSGGSVSSGGMAGTSGGASSGGGATNMGGAVTATPFPFPQNRKPQYCNLTTSPNAAEATRSAYQSFVSRFVVSASPGVGLRVRRDRNGDDTVSEGVAYGMLAALYMADKTTFDGLWAYAKAHFDNNGLMHWRILPSGSVASDGMGSAADADVDMAWALLGAAKQWGSSAYLAEGKEMVDKIYTYEIAGDGMLKPGDNWGNTPTTFPSYFPPAYFRVFAEVSGNPNWSRALLDRNYEILKNSEGTHGLVPKTTTGTSQHMDVYQYDSCRTPWRIAMDYCFNGEPRAKAYLDKIGAFFNNIGAANIVDGYNLNGTPTGNVKNMAFTGPAGVAGMANPSYQKLLDDAFAFGVSGGNDMSYYPQSLRVLTMQMMSGNFIDFTKL